MKFLSSLLLIAISQAAIIHVPAYAPTIQAGIDSAAVGDTVLVEPGTYVENINFNGKNIVVGSWFLITRDTSFIRKTIIDGGTKGHGVAFENGEPPAAELAGLTITRGSSNYGGGIYCANGSGPRLTYLYLTENLASEGAGIYCENNSNPIITNVTIIGNIGWYHSGGIHMEHASPRLENVVIKGNWSYGDLGAGAGMHCYYADPILINVIITNNYAVDKAGGIYCSHSGPLLVNVTIAGNDAYSSSHGGGIYCADSNPRLVNTILWNNSPEQVYFSWNYAQNSLMVSYSNVQGDTVGIVNRQNGKLYWLAGNISANPLFEGLQTGNVCLQEGSPCIDAGTAFFVWDGDTLVNLSPEEYVGSAPDMGAFEYGAVSVVDHAASMPTDFTLYQNYPNPFNPVTTLRYDLPEQAHVRLVIYDLLGREVGTLVNRMEGLGNKTVVWNGTDDSGKPVSSGVYLCRLLAGRYSEIKKMVLLR